MTEDHEHNPNADEQPANEQPANEQSSGEQSGSGAEQEATQQEATEGHAQERGSGDDSSNAQNSDDQNSEPPAGTTTPGTLFASDEMEDLKSEETKKKEEDQKKRKEAGSQSGSSEKRYPEGTELRYSGHTKVLPEQMSESEIFKWVADDFPEIEKDKFTLRYDASKGRLVPIAQAQKKGADTAVAEATTVTAYEVLTEPPTGEKPPVYRLLCADGVYEVRTNLSGTYIARLDAELTLAEGYYPSVPKAPASLLAEIVRIFKERPDTEALIDLVYNRRDDTFCLVWNQNRASAGNVDYDPLPDDENFVLYAEIHSHHKMSAFFSPTDNAAEVKTGVYGVVGRITDDMPEARFRYSCGGHFREMLAEDLFADPSKVAATLRRPTS